MTHRDRQLVEKCLFSVTRSIARGHLRSAARQALKLADSAEIDPASLNRVGDLLVRAHCVERAVALFEQVAEAYADEGFWLKAIAIYKKILRWAPERGDVELRLAILYQRSGLPIGSLHDGADTAAARPPGIAMQRLS